MSWRSPSFSMWFLPVLFAMVVPLPGQDIVALFDAALQDPSPTRSEIYKTVGEETLSLHIFEPESSLEPLRTALLWLHGGGWEGGSADQLFPHCACFASLGFVAISADYRLAGTGDNTIFDCVEDSRDAFYWIHDHADDLGIDADRIVVAGESAGGHLAACASTIPDPRLAGDPSAQPYPAASILVNGIFDLTTISWAMTAPGLSPGEIELARSISPIYHLNGKSPPALLLHGSVDTVVPPQQSVDYADALHALSLPANLRLWEGKSHAFFLYLPEYGLVDLQVIQLSLLEIQAFLQAQHLAGDPAIDGWFSPVHLFAGPDGFRSFSELDVVDGQLYGSTYKGGADDMGILFRLDPVTSDYEVLHEFDGSDGREIFNGLATDGTRLYGVGKFGGTGNGGTLFSIATDGSDFQILYNFVQPSMSGFYPHAGPILVDDILYGTTYHGGSTTYGGAIYRYPLPSGPYEVLHSFVPEEGRHPTGQLTQVGDWLYGTASDFFEDAGGHYGSLYRINPANGQFELLHSFDNAGEGGHPYDELLYDGTDFLYGTTFGEPANPSSMGTIFAYSISNDTLTIVHDFAANPGTGSKPNGSIIRVDDSGYLYGTCHGSNDAGGEIGTLFRVRNDGTGFTVLHRFTEGLEGNTPMRTIAYTGGSFFGTTAFGGLTTDVTNPETGPGMVFRYEPVPDKSALREDYINWLVQHGMLVNQPLSSNADRDSLDLFEEYAFDGDPAMPDADPAMGFSLQPDNGLRLRVDRIRGLALSGLSILTGNDLASWTVDTDLTQSILEDPQDPAFRTVDLDWSANTLSSGPFFVRLQIDLP